MAGDRGYDTRDFVATSRSLTVTPHVTQNAERPGGSALDARTARHPLEQAITFYCSHGAKTETNGKRRINAVIFVRVERARPLIAHVHDLGEDAAQMTARTRASFDAVLARRDPSNT